ncbi:AAA family ATPase, partial [Candidatus Margulisiibacteriota bacterium]
MLQIELNDQFQKAHKLLEKTKQCLFITGKAGTGKSTLLTYFINNTKKIVVVLAPTGVAALNVKGETIHSFFRFKPGITVETAKKKARKVKENSIYHKIDAIVIDEISMVRADLLDCIDEFLKTALKKRKPFGGVQMVFIGDLYQLPPVLTNQEKEHFNLVYDSPYFFSSKVMTSGKFKLSFVELEKVYRQSEYEFIELLNAIRNNSVTEDQLGQFNKNVNLNCQENDLGYIYLTT